jgi:hypothetical protein
MIVRLIIFNKDGKKTVQPLALHHTGATAPELKLVLDTSTEHFSEWLFFFLRDLGAYIETTDPDMVAKALNMPAGESGIVRVDS